MREIVLDTETTGLDPTKGDRLVEIGAIEIVSDTVVRAPTHKQAPLTLADYLKARGPR